MKVDMHTRNNIGLGVMVIVFNDRKW